MESFFCCHCFKNGSMTQFALILKPILLKADSFIIVINLIFGLRGQKKLAFILFYYSIFCFKHAASIFNTLGKWHVLLYLNCMLFFLEHFYKSSESKILLYVDIEINLKTFQSTNLKCSNSCFIFTNKSITNQQKSNLFH